MQSVDIFHNILWSTYKGKVFQSLQKLGIEQGVKFNFFQIAETEKIRLSLRSAEVAEHNYNYKLLYEGCYEDIPKLNLYRKLFSILVKSDSNSIVLPGYHLPEHWLMLVLSMLLRKRIYVFCDSTDADNKKVFFKEKLKKIFFSRLDGVFAYGTKSKDYVEQYGLSSDKVYFPVSAAKIPNVDYQQSLLIAERTKVYERDTKIVSFVGRLSPEKAIKELLIAFIQSSNKYPNINIEIAGDGPLKTELNTLIEDNNLGDRVKILGQLNETELSNLYRRSAALILPSFSEPWGLVVNESYYYGCPAIISESCGCNPDLIINEKTQSFRAENMNAAFSNLDRLFSNRESYLKLSASCKELISEYTPDNAAKNMLKAFI